MPLRALCASLEDSVLTAYIEGRSIVYECPNPGCKDRVHRHGRIENEVYATRVSHCAAQPGGQVTMRVAEADERMPASLARILKRRAARFAPRKEIA